MPAEVWMDYLQQPTSRAPGTGDKRRVCIQKIFWIPKASGEQTRSYIWHARSMGCRSEGPGIRCLMTDGDDGEIHIRIIQQFSGTDIPDERNEIGRTICCSGRIGNRSPPPPPT